MNEGVEDRQQPRDRDCYRNCGLRSRLEMRGNRADDEIPWISSYEQTVSELAFFCAALGGYFRTELRLRLGQLAKWLRRIVDLAIHLAASVTEQREDAEHAVLHY